MLVLEQGDVLVISTSKVPLDIKPVERDAGRIVLAYGEVPGHAHALLDRDVELYELPGSDDRFFMSASDFELRHEEPATLVLPRGDYLLRLQREFTSADMAPIRVAD